MEIKFDTAARFLSRMGLELRIQMSHTDCQGNIVSRHYLVTKEFQVSAGEFMGELIFTNGIWTNSNIYLKNLIATLHPNSVLLFLKEAPNIFTMDCVFVSQPDGVN